MEQILENVSSPNGQMAASCAMPVVKPPDNEDMPIHVPDSLDMQGQEEEPLTTNEEPEERVSCRLCMRGECAPLRISSIGSTL